MWLGGYFVTRTSARILSLVLLALPLFAAGCMDAVNAFPAAENANEAALVMRRSVQGPVIVVFTPYPLRSDAPPDGVHAAVMKTSAGLNCSVAAFHWPERAMAERWIDEQIALRRSHGLRTRMIIAGHSLAAASASDLAREVAERRPDAVVTLLLTVDAVRSGRISSAAGTAGAVIGGKLQGVKISLVAYDAAPPVDGRRLLRHINYYQQKTPLYHGAEMSGAENHLLSDSTGLLNHANVDDFAFSLMVGDLRAALGRGGVR